MKRFRLAILCILILSVVFLCSGCAVNLQDFENAKVRQYAETMLDALIADDFESAYALVNGMCSESEFSGIFDQMQSVVGSTEIYELKLLSIHVNSNITNGERKNITSSVYEMTTDSGRIIVSLQVEEQLGLYSFYLTPYEKTDYYHTGTLQNMENATLGQWLFLLLNVVSIGVAVFAVVDCCRRKIKKKVLWILLVIFGFVTLGITAAATAVRMNFNLGWITAYSAWIRYGSGAVTIRLLLPAGAIAYFAARRSLLQSPISDMVLPETDTADNASAAEQTDEPDIQV